MPCLPHQMSRGGDSTQGPGILTPIANDCCSVWHLESGKDAAKGLRLHVCSRQEHQQDALAITFKALCGRCRRCMPGVLAKLSKNGIATSASTSGVEMWRTGGIKPCMTPGMYASYLPVQKASVPTTALAEH